MPFPFIIKAGREIGKEKSGRPCEEILQGRSRLEDRQDTLISDLFAPTGRPCARAVTAMSRLACLMMFPRHPPPPKEKARRMSHIQQA